MSNAFNTHNNPNPSFQQLIADKINAQRQQERFQRQPDGSYTSMTQQQMQNTQMQQPKINSPMYPNYPGLQPNGLPPYNQPHPGITPWQGMDSFNKLAEEFNKTRDGLRKIYESKEIVNSNELMSAKNYTILQKLSEDDDLNGLYFSNPDYVWRLFERALTSDGMWMDNVFAIINADDALMFTTPDLTLRVTMRNMKLIYEDSQTKPLNKTQVLSGLVPILQFIEKVYTEDEERKRLEELERIKDLELNSGGEEDTEAVESDFDEDSEQMCSSGPIRLHTRKIKNPKANFTKFVKRVSDAAPNGKQYLNVNTGELIAIIKRIKPSAENEGLLKLDYRPRVTERGIHVIDNKRIIINIDGLYIDLSEMPHEPLIKHFQYANLNNPCIVAATIKLCRVLDTLIGSN